MYYNYTLQNKRDKPETNQKLVRFCLSESKTSRFLFEPFYTLCYLKVNIYIMNNSIKKNLLNPYRIGCFGWHFFIELSYKVFWNALYFSVVAAIAHTFRLLDIWRIPMHSQLYLLAFREMEKGIHKLDYISVVHTRGSRNIQQPWVQVQYYEEILWQLIMDLSFQYFLENKIKS